MGSKLFVGSLSWNTTDQTLQDFFAKIGTVISANVIFDKATNRSRGFGFVEFSSEEEAKKALDQLNGQELDGRKINVSFAQPKNNDRPRYENR